MRVRATTAGYRAAMATLLALAFALRLLSPAGFMPSFENGAVTIVACPDASPTASMLAHHHHHGKIASQPCPFAAAAAAGALPGAGPAIALPLAVPPSLQPTSVAQRLGPARTRDRPPATGPPLLPA